MARITYPLNKLVRDDFGRPSAVLAVNKPASFTSHDVVNVARKHLGTRKVGHAGALDPFATGVIILVVGKATKLSDELMAQEKSYRAQILFGAASETQDPEGKIVEVDNEILEKVSEQKIDQVLTEMRQGYEQFVPVYSSVKVDGDKLRVLARRYANIETYMKGDQKYVRFSDGNRPTREVALPTHKIDFAELKLTELTEMSVGDMKAIGEYQQQFVERLQGKSDIDAFPVATVDTSCPKGTYIRQLAEDIGQAMNPQVPTMLLTLERTRVGNATVDQALSLEQLSEL